MSQPELEFIVSQGKYLLAHWDEEKKLDLLSKIKEFLESLREDDPLFYSKGLIPKLSPSVDQKHLRILLIPFQREFVRLEHEEGFEVSHQDSANKRKRPPCELYFVLENIRSAYNVGSIIRLAECLGVKEVLLTGYTPREDHPKVQKTSMGCEKLIHFKYFDNPLESISYLKSKEVLICGLETVSSSEDLFESSLNPRQPKAIVVGNERHGISYDLLSSCDILLKIPVYGLKNSLNVTSALSVTAYKISHSSFS